MKWQIIFLLLMGIKWRFVYSTCVFESDFGFTLNCGFKKSSMFRVRNLGGLKSYFGLGFSLGDELGFKESLSMVEPTNRRRSAAGYFAPLMNTTSQSRSFSESSSLPKPSLAWSQVESDKTNRSGHAIKLRSPVRHKTVASLINGVPPFRPIAPAGGIPELHKSNRPVRVTKTRDEDSVTVVAVPAFAALPQSIAKIEHIAPSSSSNTNNRRISYNPLMGQRNEVADISNSLSTVTHSTPVTTSADSLLPDAVEHALKNVAHATNISADALLASIQLRQQQILYQQQKQLAALAATTSVTTATETSSVRNAPAPIPIVVADAVVDHGHPIIVTAPVNTGGFLNVIPHRVNNPNSNTFAVQPTAAVPIAVQPTAAVPIAVQPATPVPIAVQPAAPVPIAVQPAAPVPALSQPYPAYPAPMPDTSNSIEYSPPPVPQSLSRPQRQKYTMAGAHKVMNAPKEYYPINYDKNFDDNFTSRVELPDTPFNCGDQKHFPGLYADEDLNCMVFHVCALTDEGLVMKSFLCPESTLFDQTILKCNWWFYVDCKASKKLYDSNIPISKSYQLMKALTFFSSYSKNEKSSEKSTEKSSEKSS